jgi:acetylglutamate/LysW-gamma-L-alpha-aminoadipate kinase
LVHGGSARVNEIAAKLGHPPQFVTSPSGYTSRRTDYETLKIFTMVLAGSINAQIVAQLQAKGVNAIGLAGLDGRLLQGARKKVIKVIQNGRLSILRDDYTGIVEQVNTHLLNVLLNSGYAPVICPPAISHEHEIINVDSDRAAASIAVALDAETLILLTGVPGVLQDLGDPNSVIPLLNRSQIDEAIENYARGRMKHKLLAASEAIKGGIGRVIISSSAKQNPIKSALEGAGTLVQ